MTSYHQLTLSWIGVNPDGEWTSEEQSIMDKMLIRDCANAATECNAAVWISENGHIWEDDEVPLGAVIPAKLARELIEEGRLNHPPLASITVLA